MKKSDGHCSLPPRSKGCAEALRIQTFFWRIPFSEIPPWANLASRSMSTTRTTLKKPMHAIPLKRQNCRTRRASDRVPLTRGLTCQESTVVRRLPAQTGRIHAYNHRCTDPWRLTLVLALYRQASQILGRERTRHIRFHDQSRGRGPGGGEQGQRGDEGTATGSE